MQCRPATVNDSRLLAELNAQLIADSGHRNPMGIDELEARMRGWLGGEYTARVFEDEAGPLAYALYRVGGEGVYLRQFLVLPDQRRRGVGRQAIAELRDRHWPKGKRLTVDVLVTNTAAVEFWRAVGFTDYCLTLEIFPDRDLA
ncbi:MAG: GNAT family N-acetyltransferase [Planctomycetota bacterium]